MEIYEFRSDINRVEDSSEPWLTVETELFLSKSKAIEFMVKEALEYENTYSSANFYRKVKDYPKDSEVIELESSRDSDVYGLFSVTEREINE